ncbi:hypothetical protein IWW34DRAFT_300983 [Fusarium oxysporum f. sp. albedinis]|nr:hypothetical protein IWW34DRAFT_300983 [Fusarium oxysporum f. sp. albedinis]
MIIDRSDCDVGLPSPALDGVEHSPFTRMRLLSTVIQHLFAQFGSTKNVTDPSAIEKYQRIITSWAREFHLPMICATRTSLWMCLTHGPSSTGTVCALLSSQCYLIPSAPSSARSLCHRPWRPSLGAIAMAWASAWSLLLHCAGSSTL